MTAQLEHKFPPLPRQRPDYQAEEQDRYEIVIIGAGPAGAFLNLLLARFGISSRLCIESSPGPVTTGHADGLTLRTTEILKSLDLADEFLNHATKIYHFMDWMGSAGNGISRNPAGNQLPLHLKYTSRFDWPVCTIHQGWILKVLNQDLAKYSPNNGVEYGTALADLTIDSDQDPDYPVLATLSTCGQQSRTVRAKYLVGADGAHSVVRKALGIEMLGDSTDHLYGVINMVASTNFPDVRKAGRISDDTGTMLMVPREKINSGDWLTRYYVPFLDSASSVEFTEENVTAAVEKQNLAARKIGMTPEGIISRV